MIEGGGSKNSETNHNDNTENKSSATEKLYQGLAKLSMKLNYMLFDDDGSEKSKENTEEKSAEMDEEDTSESNNDVNEKDTNDTTSDIAEELFSRSISELMNRLFADDENIITDETEKDAKDEDTVTDSNQPEKTESDLETQDSQEVDKSDAAESDVEKKQDPIMEQIEKTLSTSEGIKALIERHPEKAELWKTQLEALDVLNDPDATPAEIRSAQAKLNSLKGQLLEMAVKDALIDAGFDVEPQQRVVEGESGGTRPDIIAKNNTDQPIEVFGVTIQPGETLSVECKCGGSPYMTNQLKNHIPNQLSGQEGTKILLTTSDIKDTPPGLAKAVCDRYGAKLVIANVGVEVIENAIKEVAES